MYLYSCSTEAIETQNLQWEGLGLENFPKSNNYEALTIMTY